MWLRNLKRAESLVNGTTGNLVWSIGLFGLCLVSVCVAAGLVIYQQLTLQEMQQVQLQREE
jgi:hypothetical protein